MMLTRSSSARMRAAASFGANAAGWLGDPASVLPFCEALDVEAEEHGAFEVGFHFDLMLADDQVARAANLPGAASVDRLGGGNPRKDTARYLDLDCRAVDLVPCTTSRNRKGAAAPKGGRVPEGVGPRAQQATPVDELQAALSRRQRRLEECPHLLGSHG